MSKLLSRIGRALPVLLAACGLAGLAPHAGAAIADLRARVQMGAAWPATGGTGPASRTEATFDLHKRKAEHWAWRPVKAQAPPTVKNATWPRTPADRFILARLEARGLAPAP